MPTSTAGYAIILGKDTFTRIGNYAAYLRGGGESGENLARELQANDLESLDSTLLLYAMLNSKKPQIFAESAVMGDGSDWTLNELGILGDISIAMVVTIYDNGAHQKPVIHETPFTGHLVYTAGALLRNDRGEAPADWQAVIIDGECDSDKYYHLYERRLLPVLNYINQCAVKRNRPAFISIPGIGCGQFAGPFMGQMGHMFQTVLVSLLKNYGESFPNIKAVYYDPYSECQNGTQLIHGIQFMVRPLTQNNAGKSQLCQPSFLGQDSGGDFRACELYSLVAWDHVSWPGNDYYRGARVTDDGVKAAATNTMEVMTGLKGHYCLNGKMYCAPEPFNNWYGVVRENNLKIAVKDNLYVV